MLRRYDKASSFDVNSLEKAVSITSHKAVEDKLIKHLYKGKYLEVDRLDTTIYKKDSIRNMTVRLGYNRFERKVPPGLYVITS